MDVGPLRRPLAENIMTKPWDGPEIAVSHNGHVLMSVSIGVVPESRKGILDVQVVVLLA